MLFMYEVYEQIVLWSRRMWLRQHSNSADVTPEGHLGNMVVRKGEGKRAEMGAFVVQVHGT